MFNAMRTPELAVEGKRSTELQCYSSPTLWSKTRSWLKGSVQQGNPSNTSPVGLQDTTDLPKMRLNFPSHL